jgi:hypothetical protein
MGESGSEDSKKRMTSPWWAMEEKTTCGDIIQTEPTTHVPSPSYNFSNYLPGKRLQSHDVASFNIGWTDCIYTDHDNIVYQPNIDHLMSSRSMKKMKAGTLLPPVGLCKLLTAHSTPKTCTMVGMKMRGRRAGATTSACLCHAYINFSAHTFPSPGVCGQHNRVCLDGCVRGCTKVC